MGKFTITLSKNVSTKTSINKCIKSFKASHDNQVIDGKGFPDGDLFCYCFTQIVSKIKKIFGHYYEDYFELDDDVKLPCLTIMGEIKINVREAKHIDKIIQEKGLNFLNVNFDSIWISPCAIEVLRKYQVPNSLNDDDDDDDDSPQFKMNHCKLVIKTQQESNFSFWYTNYNDDKDGKVSDCKVKIKFKDVDDDDVILDMNTAKQIATECGEIDSELHNHSDDGVVISCNAMSVEALKILAQAYDHIQCCSEQCQIYYDNDINGKNNSLQLNNYQTPQFLTRSLVIDHEDRTCTISGTEITNQRDANTFVDIFSKMYLSNLDFVNCSISLDMLKILLPPIFKKVFGNSNLENLVFENCTFLSKNDNFDNNNCAKDTATRIGCLEWRQEYSNELIYCIGINETKFSIAMVMEQIVEEFFPLDHFHIKAINLNQAQVKQIGKHHFTTTKLKRITLEVANKKSLEKHLFKLTKNKCPESRDLFIQEYKFDLKKDIIQGDLQQNNHHDTTKIDVEHVDMVDWDYDHWCKKNLREHLFFFLNWNQIKFNNFIETADTQNLLVPFVAAKMPNILYWILRQIPHVVKVVAVQKINHAGQKRKR